MIKVPCINGIWFIINDACFVMGNSHQLKGKGLYKNCNKHTELKFME